MLRQPPPKKSRLKGNAYFGFVALLALLVSGAVTWVFHQPEWTIGLTYQLLPVDETLNRGESEQAQFWSQKSLDNFAQTQMALLESEHFMEQLKAKLPDKLGKSLSIRQLSHAVRTNHLVHSDLLDVTLESTQPGQLLPLAHSLDQTYEDVIRHFELDRLEAQRSFVAHRLGQTIDRLNHGQADLNKVLAAQPKLKDTPFALDPDWGEKELANNYSDINQALKQTEEDIALAETQYHHLQSFLSQDEKKLVEGAVLGDDPTIAKLTDQLAAAETDAHIVSVKYTPGEDDNPDSSSKVRALKRQLDEQRQHVLAQLSQHEKPILRDRFRRDLLAQMISSEIKLQAATKAHGRLEQQRDDLLKEMASVAGTMGSYNSWLFEKDLLQKTKISEEKLLSDIDYQRSHLQLPIKLIQPIPSKPQPAHDPGQAWMLFLSTFSGLFCMLSAVPFYQQYRTQKIPRQPLLDLVEALIQTKGQHIIMLMPVTSTGHLNASVHISGLLNQFGRDSVVIDMDLNNRLLSRKLPTESHQGLFEHFLNPDMKKPYVDPLSLARILPLEAPISSDKIVELSQVVQRMPRIWERWPASVIILDLAKWHEAYHQLLPYVAQVVFYVPPAHPASLLLPQIFKSKYQVPVSLIEIQPD